MLRRSIIKFGDLLALPFIEPLVRLTAWDAPREQCRKLLVSLGMPALAFGIFLGLWSLASRNIHTNYGTLPSPSQVWKEGRQLLIAHFETREQQNAFVAKNEAYAAKLRRASAHQSVLAKEATGAEKELLLQQSVELEKKAQQRSMRRYSAPPSFLDQIRTSLLTVFTGFCIATLIAIPLGVLCGVSKTFQAALSPLIQIFKPVSPLAWLPIVMICVGSMYTTNPNEAWFSKSFVSSAVTVALCSLWPTLVNTALGVSSIDKDYTNVARVLKLGFWTRLRKIIIPASLPLVFTGLRISLGVGWMVLIAAEMLAQNPGLGKFVWDMFQNGSRQTLAQIMVAVFVIGFLGFLLDRVMVILQRSVSYGTVAAS